MAAFEDEFAPPSGDPSLADHTPNVGTGWDWNGTAGFGAWSARSSTGQARSTGGDGRSFAAGSHGIVPNLGSADHQVWGQRNAFENVTVGALSLCVRMTDKDNLYGFWPRGTGSGGNRFVSRTAGTQTELITWQGVSGEWLRVKAVGTTISVWVAAAGAEPASPGADTNWTQVGADFTSQTDHQTQTRCGMANYSTTVANELQNSFRADVYPVGGAAGAAVPVQRRRRFASMLAR